MTITTCSNCKKEFNQKYFHKENKHHFCCKKCEAEFRRGISLTHLKKYNEIEIKENFAIIKIKNNIHGEFECLIDIEDIEKIKNYYWNIRYDKRHPNCIPYVESIKHDFERKIKRIHIHRLIMNCPHNKVVDHINHNNLDNRKCNLRILTQQQNACNKKTYNGNYLQGVYLCKRRKQKKFCATFRGEFLDSFFTEEEAHKKYLKAKEDYFAHLD